VTIMRRENTHVTDQDLLLASDGELSARDAARVESHLAACWECRVRNQELEQAVAGFLRAHQSNFDAQLPAAAGPRALLKAQLAQLARAGSAGERNEPIASWALAALALALLVVGIFGGFTVFGPTRTLRASAVAVPNPSLTPGATVLMSPVELCGGPNVNNKAVPVALRRQVFAEYGIAAAEPRAYEVDYLITPALGGADDIHNLWPQSYSNTVWNAQVKDALEDHLHQMVCEGNLDLATAQREIAVNWIEAYKKYFHTDRPLTRVQ
jgi:hypothetical protein